MTALDTTTSLEQLSAALDCPEACQGKGCGNTPVRWFGIPPCGDALAFCNKCHEYQTTDPFPGVVVVILVCGCGSEFSPSSVRWEPIR